MDTQAIPLFEQWWKTYWKTNGMPGAFNEAMKEVARASWVESREVAKAEKQLS